MKIYALSCYFNRCQITLRTIEQLHSTLERAAVPFEIVLVDDKSTDNTTIEIKTRFPTVNVIRGSGELYWAGAMREAWKVVQSRVSSEDYVLVFNDDIELFPKEALEMITSVKHHTNDHKHRILVGSFVERETGALTYGTWRNVSRLRPLTFLRTPPGQSHATTFNMNFALIPVPIITEIGFLKSYFIHGDADFEFGTRASRHNIEIFSPAVIGFCRRNSTKGTSNDNNLSPIVRFKKLLGRKEQPIKQRLYYSWFLSRWLSPVLFLSPYIRLMFRIILEKKN